MRPVVRLEPRDLDAAAITIAFSKFPGLSVRFGRWVTMGFPACGCDACNERVEDEIERLRVRVDDLVAGRFWESIRIPDVGDTWREYGFGSRESGSMRLDRDEALHLLENGPASYEWKPWRRRL